MLDVPSRDEYETVESLERRTAAAIDPIGAPLPKAKKPIYKRASSVGLVLLAAIAATSGAVMYWLYDRSFETTDDAFVDGHDIQVAPQVSGRVIRLLVEDNASVAAGQPLLELDPRDFQAKLDQAEAQLANARAQLAQAQAQIALQEAHAAEDLANIRLADAERVNAEQDLARYRSIDPRAITQQQVDGAVANVNTKAAALDAKRHAAAADLAQVDAARASVATERAAIAAAQAQVEQARLQLSYTRIDAPGPGRITNRTVEIGNYVTAGQALLAIVPNAIWVTANFKETQLTHMRPGQPATMSVDAYPGVTFHGHIDSIARGTGAYFSALPAENASGNYVKVVQRLPVKIVFDPGEMRDYLLAPGMSVVPRVTVR